MQREPAVVLGTVAAAVVAALQVLGPEYFPDLTDPLTGAISAVVVLVSAILTRQRVTPA